MITYNYVNFMLELYDTWHGGNVKACDEFNNDPMKLFGKHKTLFLCSIFLCLVVLHKFFCLSILFAIK